MANKFLAGFDDHDTAGLALDWDVEGTPTVVAGLTGNCLSLVNTSSRVHASMPSAGSYTFGFRTSFPSAPASAAVFFAAGTGVAPHIYLRLNTDRTLTVLRSNSTSWTTSISTSPLTGGTGSAVLAVNTAYYIEIQITPDDAAGTVQVRINGNPTPDINVSGQDTKNNNAAAAITRFGFWRWGTQLFDDVYANDPSGTVCTGFMGDRRVDFHLPVADGAHTAWPPSTGTDLFAVVDENPPNTTDSISTDVQDAIATFIVEAFKNNGADIEAIQITMLAQKSDVGTCGIAAVVRESGSDTVGTEQFPSTAWAHLRENYSLAVGEAKRAAAGFNAAEYGVKRTAA